MLIAIQSYLRKPEKSQISNLSVPHKATREWGGKNPQSYYINNRPEIKTENKRKYQWNEKQILWKETKPDKLLARIIKEKGKGHKSIKLEMKKEKLQETSQKYKGV